MNGRLAVLIAGIFIAATLAGCGGKPKAKGQITIGVSYQDLSNQFVIRLQNAIRAEAEKLNVKLI